MYAIKSHSSLRRGSQQSQEQVEFTVALREREIIRRALWIVHRYRRFYHRHCDIEILRYYLSYSTRPLHTGVKLYGGLSSIRAQIILHWLSKTLKWRPEWYQFKTRYVQGAGIVITWDNE